MHLWQFIGTASAGVPAAQNRTPEAVLTTKPNVSWVADTGGKVELPAG
jgi:hypothetical protein